MLIIGDNYYLIFCLFLSSQCNRISLFEELMRINASASQMKLIPVWIMYILLKILN